ncbi:tryptophan--tRNA ligase [Patescibacteria group bacterium]|nr:tryptophan--tRNA ligase [Patescibacteria group bacterium]
MKKRLFTGLQPSGQLHLGNYFGALKPFADTYQEYESFLMVADYHSLTSLKNPTELRANVVEVVRAYLALGVEPSKAVIFKQSDVQEHTELAWIFETLVTVPFLMQAHAYKDKVAKGIEPTAGLFNYPMLMAADILLYDTDVVPVGGDQRQHVEYAREAANKFNLSFGQTFTEPTEKILENVAIVPGVDGQKMSKSYKNTIPLFGFKEEITAAVMSIVTDSSGERPENVYAIHKLFKSETELASLYENNRGNYKVLKEALAEDIEAFVAPKRNKRESISVEDVKRVLAEGREKAHTIAASKMADVRQKIGVSL